MKNIPGIAFANPAPKSVPYDSGIFEKSFFAVMDNNAILKSKLREIDKDIIKSLDGFSLENNANKNGAKEMTIEII